MQSTIIRLPLNNAAPFATIRVLEADQGYHLCFEESLPRH